MAVVLLPGLPVGAGPLPFQTQLFLAAEAEFLPPPGLAGGQVLGPGILSLDLLAEAFVFLFVGGQLALLPGPVPVRRGLLAGQAVQQGRKGPDLRLKGGQPLPLPGNGGVPLPLLSLKGRVLRRSGGLEDLQGLRRANGGPAGLFPVQPGGLQALPELGQLLGQGLPFRRPGEDAPLSVHRTAGHRAAGAQDLPVQGDNGEPVAPALCQTAGVVQGVHHYGPAQEGPGRRAAALVALDHIGRHRQEPGFFLHPVLFQACGAHRGQGQTGHSSAVPPLEQLEHVPACLLVLHDEVLHGGPQGGLDGHGIPGRHVE